MRRPLQLLALLAVLSSACSKVSGPSDTIPQGIWGGVGIQMIVTAAGASIDYGCDAGTVDQPLSVSLNERFSLQGTYSFGRGGPRQVGDPPSKPQPARYEGTSDGKQLTLSVFLPDLARSAGDYRLEFGRQGSLDRCL
jgi:hypothetical protein